MSTYYVLVSPGQTVHLRSSAETQTSNVITELPRGYPVEVHSSMDPFKYVTVWDCVDTITGYVHRDWISSGYISCASDTLYIPRYSTTAWKRSSHQNNYYLPVKRIQEDLRSIGYSQVGTPDGYFGQNTDSAVRAFQAANGLTVDGIFGTNSKKKLWDLIDRRG